MMIFLRNIALVFGLILLLFTGCVEFKTAVLYDGFEPLPALDKPVSISSVVPPIIFQEEFKDMWGLEKDDCKNITKTSEATHTGTNAIKVQWDRKPELCEWAGFGIGWDDYKGKDLSSLMDYAAIQFYVRSDSGLMYNLPMVLSLEDYSGGKGFVYTANSFFERTAIDENWQAVQVPLSAFEIKKEKLDPTNVKQLMFELQQSGAIYMDDIELIFYTPKAIESWMVEESLPDPVATPRILYDDAFINNNGWGMINVGCQDFSISDKEKITGSKSIHLKWTDAENCALVSFGVSWNKWRPIDLSNVAESRAISFKIKNMGTPSGKVGIVARLNNYTYQFGDIALTSTYVKGGSYDSEWRTVTLPIQDFEPAIDLSNIKQLQFDMKGTGEVYIDDIRLVTI